MSLGIGFTRITIDSLINEGKTWLFGFHIELTVSGAFIAIYEGLDTSSGRLIGNFGGIANDNNSFIFPAPFHLDRGLYVDLGTNVTAATLYWLPDPIPAYMTPQQMNP